MDKDNNFYPHVFTWEQFQRALLYTKKYYGMDAPYFYRTANAELAGKDQPITIYNRLINGCYSLINPPPNIWSRYHKRRLQLYGR